MGTLSVRRDTLPAVQRAILTTNVYSWFGRFQFMKLGTRDDYPRDSMINIIDGKREFGERKIH
jgi:hypothetical protein